MPEGLSFGKTDRRAIDVDRQLLSGAIDDLDVLELGPWTAELFNGAATTEAGPGGGANTGAIILNNAGIDFIRWTTRVRAAWVNHVAVVTVYYTSSGGSTNNYKLVLSGDAIHAGVNMSAGHTLGSVTAIVPGPAAAWGVLTTQQVLTTPIAATTDQILSIKLHRDGAAVADTNPNDCQVLLVVVVMRPA